MKKTLVLCVMSLALLAFRQHAPDEPSGPAVRSPAARSNAASPQVTHAVLETTLGDIVIKLHRDAAPKGYENFVTYAHSGAYDGTIFHRVIPNFMVQAGGYDAKMSRRPTRAPLQNEADNGLRNERGTVAWARTSAPHSATNQFFINVKDNSFLNHRSKSFSGWGYSVFGKVVSGMEVADRISLAATKSHLQFRNVPKKPVVIRRVRLVVR